MERPKRQYTEAVKADILAYYESCRSFSETARAYGIPIPTIQSWVHGKQGVNDDIIEKATISKGNLADAFEQVAWKAIALVPDKAPEASFAQLMTGAGIAIDKALLLRGQPTSINLDLSKEDAEAEATKLAETVLLRLVEGRKSA